MIAAEQSAIIVQEKAAALGVNSTPLCQTLFIVLERKLGFRPDLGTDLDMMHAIVRAHSEAHLVQRQKNLSAESYEMLGVTSALYQPANEEQLATLAKLAVPVASALPENTPILGFHLVVGLELALLRKAMRSDHPHLGFSEALEKFFEAELQLLEDYLLFARAGFSPSDIDATFKNRL